MQCVLMLIVKKCEMKAPAPGPGERETRNSLKHGFYESYDLWRHKRLLRKHINCIFTTIQPQLVAPPLRI